MQEASSGYQEVQKANSWCLEVHKAGSGYLEVQEEGCLHRTVKKIYVMILSRPFLVPFLVPVFPQIPGPMWSIFTTKYAFSYCVVCSLHTLCSLQSDNLQSTIPTLTYLPHGEPHYGRRVFGEDGKQQLQSLIHWREQDRRPNLKSFASLLLEGGGAQGKYMHVQR